MALSCFSLLMPTIAVWVRDKIFWGESENSLLREFLLTQEKTKFL
ncbi:hypothetical protein PORCRE_477 [Porphyromonas crevioricanis JCM 15906]|uniref:Uncharacterized protein n=1 Tax=Porphyromonas crevioricanis JCM 15906 TaxID=1305617 RepID=T1CGH4_9PORP|nr:hypothetical protein PORCRE_477 [Porphyromonas crevioricanis JCM 15906]GAD08436.1 hypothetical protein PORCAN_2078 [Porphyromonas crevioricanis JCM 13913]